MITVTRLNGTRFVVNAELIRSVEQHPDTMIRLTTGETLVVRETPDQIVERVVEYGRLLRGVLTPT